MCLLLLYRILQIGWKVLWRISRGESRDVCFDSGAELLRCSKLLLVPKEHSLTVRTAHTLLLQGCYLVVISRRCW
jgi:hypothetical protein